MNTKLSAFLRGVLLTATLLRAQMIWGAPLTWFPGPSLYNPMSKVATASTARYGNAMVGGTAYDPNFGVSYAESLVATNDFWFDLGAFYSINVACGASVIDGNIIIYGGTDGSTSQNSVAILALNGDAAPTYAPMNIPRSYLGYATDRNSRAYAIGGLDDHVQPLASVERFDFTVGPNGTWSAIASLPVARFDFPAVFDRTNQIYILGGYTNITDGEEIASVMRYSVTHNNWTNLAPMPVAVAGSAATLGVDGKVYVVGGTSGGAAVNLVQVYNPVSNSWTTSTPLPEALSDSALSVDSLGRLIVMGGSDETGTAVSDVWRSQPMGLPDVAPVLTGFPATNATYLAAYTSSINATGNPPPTYQLVSGPAGMSVNTYSGTITWTPMGLDQIGTFPATISASNYAGSTNWNFTITVPNPPPTPVSNLTVVAVTETSVTLSWSPEDPTVGPVTYSVWLRHVLHDPKGSGATIWYTQIGGTTNNNITIGGLAAGLSQNYYVRATGPGGTSAYSSIGASTLPAPAPTNFHVTGLTSTTISLAWNAPVGGLPVATYSILGWFNGIAAQYPLSIPNIPGTSITISNLAPGIPMLWGLSVKDTFGNVSTSVYLPSLVANPVPVTPILSIGSQPGTIGNGPGQAAGGFQITVTEGGSVLQTIFIEATANPEDPNSWIQIGSVFPTNNPFTFTDTNVAQYPLRVYRVVAP